ncbi:MAG: biopolymer transporter ExbD [Bacteroidota bacterium]
MPLEQRNKINPMFNMSSMTDIVFLLLLFFILTSGSVIPLSLPIDPPSSKSSVKVLPKVHVAITKDLEYAVGETKINASQLETEIRRALPLDDEGVVVLHADKTVPVEKVIEVVDIANRLGVKISVAIQPAS